MAAVMDTSPISASTMERMNSLLAGTSNPTCRELIQISEDCDVSINYVLTGDEMYPSLHRVPKKDAERIISEIEKLRPEPDVQKLATSGIYSVFCFQYLKFCGLWQESLTGVQEMVQESTGKILKSQNPVDFIRGFCYDSHVSFVLMCRGKESASAG